MSDLIKYKIMRNFNKAALTYDQASFLQKEVGITLLNQLNSLNFYPNHILDIGSGTGFLAQKIIDKYPDANIFSLDFSYNMLKVAKKNNQENIYCICADFDYIPLKAQCMDLVSVNLALQWSLNFSGTLFNISQLLKKKGYLLFSTLGPKTFQELRACWAKVDNAKHINNMLSLNSIKQALKINHFETVNLVQKTKRVRFASFYHIMRHIKDVGANYVIQRNKNQLTSKNSFKLIEEVYQQLADANGFLPLTYDVIYILAVK